MNDPRIVKKYLERLLSHLREHNTLERARQLHAEVEEALSYGRHELFPDQKLLFNQLEDERVFAMMDAEKKCRHIYRGTVPWSPDLARAYTVAYYWRKSLHHKQGRKVKTRFLRRLRRKVGIEYTPMTADQISAKLQLAYEELAIVKQEALSRRQTFAEQLIESYEQAGYPNAAKIVEQLLKHERDRRDFAIIRHLTGKAAKGSVSFVQERDDEGVLHDCRTKEAIEEACLRENDQRFRLASDTPMLQEPLISDFGPYGVTEAAQQVLDGTYVPPEGTDPYFTALLPYLKQTTEIRANPIDFSLNLENYRARWNRAKERTSSSPSGLHFGHYKACAQDDEASEVQAILGYIPLRTGYRPQRWKRAVNCMLGKGKGNEVTNLRTICLFEADFNYENGEIGRKNIAQHQGGENSRFWFRRQVFPGSNPDLAHLFLIFRARVFFIPALHRTHTQYLHFPQNF